MVLRMVERTRVMVVMGLVVVFLLLTSVLGQEPTAERRIAQGPGRNGKARFSEKYFGGFFGWEPRLKRCHLWLLGFQF